MKNEEIILKKIELRSFIDSLIEIYNEGVDFIDIIGTPGIVKDSLTIVGRQDVRQENPEENLKPLSEEDINHLASI